MFNTLPTNFLKSKFKNNLLNVNNTNNDFIDKKNNILTKYSIFLSYLLNSSYVNLNCYSHSNNNNMFLNDIYKNFNSNYLNNVENYNLKDIYLLINDNDLLTKDNLNILY